jgi:hypothetical protein
LEFFPRLGAIESHIPTDVKLVRKVDPQCQRATEVDGSESEFSQAERLAVIQSIRRSAPRAIALVGMR